MSSFELLHEHDELGECKLMGFGYTDCVPEMAVKWLNQRHC